MRMWIHWQCTKKCEAVGDVCTLHASIDVEGGDPSNLTFPDACPWEIGTPTWRKVSAKELGRKWKECRPCHAKELKKSQKRTSRDVNPYEISMMEEK